MFRADPMLTAEERRLLQRKRRRLFVLAGALVAGGLAVYFAARPTRDAIKGWQARRHAEKAFPLIEKQKWDDARAEAVAAYQLRPTEPAALRAVARFLSRTRQPQALKFWEQLREQQPLTREDLRDEAGVALMAGESERAKVAIEALVERKDAAAADWFLAAQLDLQRSRPEAAQDYLQKILDAPSSSAREQLQAAVLRLALETPDQSASKERHTAALEKLRALGTRPDEVGLDALIVLAQRALRQNPKSEEADSPAAIPAKDLIHAIESHPLAKAPHALVAVDLQLQAAPNEKETLLAGAIARWKDADAESLATLATWLNGHGEFERELATVPLEKALQTRELFLQHVDALGALGRWGEIKQLLGSERFPLDPVMQRMYLARCSAQLGEKVAAENNWKRALEAAGGDLQKLLALADYAGKNGASEIAASAYDAAATVAPKLRAAQQGRLRLAEAAKDTPRLHAILAEMLKLWPDEVAIQNDEAYLRLLLLPQIGDGRSKVGDGGTSAVPSITTNEELISVERLAERLVQREPASLPHRTLLALARLKQNQPAAALEVYANIQTSPRALTPSALAVHAAVLVANDQRESARQEIAAVSPEQLLPEERALLPADLQEKR
ncbi:MAG TPA: hypothetical protein VK474_02665 [Chthoniobacterales bacterium]|nr:hypothetical protein [Chthoniobacterales bacterium]